MYEADTGGKLIVHLEKDNVFCCVNGQDRMTVAMTNRRIMVCLPIVIISF